MANDVEYKYIEVRTVDCDWTAVTASVAASFGARSAAGAAQQLRTVLRVTHGAAAAAASTSPPLAERLLALCRAVEGDLNDDDDDASRVCVTILLTLPRADSACIARLVQGGRRAVKVRRAGDEDVYEVRSPLDASPLLGSSADTPERRLQKYKVEKRLQLEEEPNAASALAKHTLFFDKAGALVAKGYARVLYGDHGCYVELALAHLDLSGAAAEDYFDLTPQAAADGSSSSYARIAGGPYYDIVRGVHPQSSRLQMYIQRTTVSDRPNPPAGRDAAKHARPEGYADYRPGFCYIAVQKLVVQLRDEEGARNVGPRRTTAKANKAKQLTLHSALFHALRARGFLRPTEDELAVAEAGAPSGRSGSEEEGGGSSGAHATKELETDEEVEERAAEAEAEAEAEAMERTLRVVPKGSMTSSSVAAALGERAHVNQCVQAMVWSLHYRTAAVIESVGAGAGVAAAGGESSDSNNGDEKARAQSAPSASHGGGSSAAPRNSIAYPSHCVVITQGNAPPVSPAKLVALLRLRTSMCV